MLTADTIIGRGDKHVETEVAEQTMMMNIDRGKYYALEGTAKLIWGELKDPMRIEDLVTKLTKTYDVEPEQCMSDVMAFVSELMENELVVAKTTSP